MRIFNEETERQKECVLIASFEELRLLHEMAIEAVRVNPRRTTWRNLLKKLDALAVY